MLIFAQVIKLCVQAQVLYLLILNIKSCITAEFATQLLGESDTDQNRNTIYQNALIEPRQSKIASWLAKRSPD